MVTLILVFAIALVLSFVPLGYTFVRNYLRFRRASAVKCPETGLPATVQVNAAGTALSAAVRDDPRYRISSCSNWPAHKDCGGKCGEEVQSALASNFR